MSDKLKSLVYFICLLISSAAYYNMENPSSPDVADKVEMAQAETTTVAVLENNVQEEVQ